MPKDILKVTNLKKSFVANDAVKGVSFSIPAKKVFALIGPNGAGKTTIVKMITGLLDPDSGSASVAGKSIITSQLEAKANIGYIPDDPFMYQHLTGREFLHLTANLHSVEPSKAQEHIEAYAKRFQVNDIIDGRFTDYSRGNKQKVVIIAALLHQPKLLIFDEPIVGLDAHSQLEVEKIIKETTKAGGAVLLCTHTLQYAQNVADYFGILDQGELIADGTISALRKKFGKSADLQKIMLKATQK